MTYLFTPLSSTLGEVLSTPRSPTQEQIVGEKTAEAVLVPFIELRCSDKNKRVNPALGILSTTTN